MWLDTIEKRTWRQESIFSLLSWDRIPELKDPVLVMGYHGWPNAGGVSSDTLCYLMEILKPRLIARFDEEAFLNYGSDRPVAQIEDGIIHDLTRACRN